MAKQALADCDTPTKPEGRRQWRTFAAGDWKWVEYGEDQQDSLEQAFQDGRKELPRLFIPNAGVFRSDLTSMEQITLEGVAQGLVRYIRRV